MSEGEELAQKLLRILFRLSHDPLLQQADLTGDLGDQLCLPVCDRGHDRIRQAKRGRRQPAAIHPGRRRLGLAQG